MMIIKTNIVLKTILLSGLLLITASGATDTTDDSSENTIALNLQTLEAETEFGTLQAEQAEHSYTGPVGEGRAIGITFLGEVTSRDQDPEQIVVYLYDGEDLALMIGEVDADGAGMLESGNLSDFNASVDLRIEDNVVFGTTTFPDQEETPFTAKLTSDIAGVYWAEGTDENPDVSSYWVVLSDHRQWGCVCVPPFGMACCTLQF